MRNIKQLNPLVLVLMLAAMTGCAAYRTNSDVEFDSTSVETAPTDVLILEGKPEDDNYTVIGPIEAVVKKLTAFHKNPTQEQVDIVLTEKATQMGANAVMDVEYKHGVGFATWGYMKATGTAIKTEG